MENIEKVREQFPMTKNRAFMNNAGESLPPKQVADVVCRFVADFSKFGASSIEWNDRAMKDSSARCCLV